jgi:hypothetical protein
MDRGVLPIYHTLRRLLGGLLRLRS